MISTDLSSSPNTSSLQLSYEALSQFVLKERVHQPFSGWSGIRGNLAPSVLGASASGWVEAVMAVVGRGRRLLGTQAASLWDAYRITSLRATGERLNFLSSKEVYAAWARVQAARGGWGIHKYSWTEGCDSCLGTHPTSQRSGWEVFPNLAHGWVFRHGVGDLQPHLNQVSLSGFRVSHFRKGLEKWEADPIGKLGFDHSHLVFSFRLRSG